MVKCVAVVRDYPLGDCSFDVLHEGRSHHVEAEKEAKEGEEEGVCNVDSALEVESVLGRCVELDAVGHLTPGLHEDPVNIHFTAHEGTEVSLEV